MRQTRTDAAEDIGGPADRSVGGLGLRHGAPPELEGRDEARRGRATHTGNPLEGRHVGGCETVERRKTLGEGPGDANRGRVAAPASDQQREELLSGEVAGPHPAQALAGSLTRVTSPQPIHVGS
jgi:hypothetical protein